MPSDPFKPAPTVETAEPAPPADVYPTSNATTVESEPATPEPPAAPAAPPEPTASQSDVPAAAAAAAEASGGETAGVRALQEAFAIDIAEREERHRAEVRAMQQSFMTDVAAREDRHRAEVQALHQRFSAEAATREDRQRAEVSELQQLLGNVRAQLGEATAARDREAEARAVSEAEVERLRDEIQVQRSDINRLNNARADLGSQLAASKQETEKWSEQARRVEVELRNAKSDAEKAAAAAQRQYDEKVRDLEETERRLEETARALTLTEEKVARLTDQAAALEAASAQLRQTIAEQRAERERITAERDAARQQASDFEAQLRKTEFEAEQADEDGARQLDEAARKVEAAEEAAARAVGQVAVHEATIEELRRAVSEAQIELKKAQVDRDAARRRIQSLEAEVALLEGDARSDADTDGDDTEAADDDTAAASDAAPALDVPAVALDESDRPLALSSDIELVAWQREALAAWTATGNRGVVEAVSGAGKTALAHWAIALAVDEGMKVLVITPTAEQVEAWYDGLRAALPINRVGKPNGGREENLRGCDVVVTTAAEAANDSFFGTAFKGMIVADQAHTLGTREASRALDPLFQWRLGLSAAYERDDNGIATYLEPYFGRVSFSLGYARALRDEVIAPFDIAMVPVSLNTAERAEYDALGQQMETLAAELVSEHHVPAEPAHEFATGVVTLAEGRMGPPRTAARAYQKALAKRDEIVTRAASKSSVLKSLAGYIATSEPALIFTSSPAEAASVTKLFGAERCAIRSLSGGGERRLLGRRTDDSRDDVRLLAGSANADTPVCLGVMVGASGAKHQLVQRLGSIIAKRADGDRPARLVAVYVEGTAEDDYSGPDAVLASAVAPFAGRQETFGTGELVSLIDFLVGAEEPAEPDADADAE
jgi:RNA polymerase primary sigma factor